MPVNREDIRRKTKIVCTLGPRTSSVEQISKLLEAGMNIARLNFSHGNHEFHGNLIKNIREASSQTGKLCAILLDTKGPEIRTGKLKNKEGVKITEGQTFHFYAKEIEGDENGVTLSYKNFPKQLKNGSKILCADGKFGFTVIKIEPDHVVTRAENSGTLGENKNVNLPQTIVDLPTLGERDIDDIAFGVEQDIDFIAASFIRSAEDVRNIRAVKGVKEKGIMIISKIENQQGLDHFDEILKEGDGIMVARGDLGMEVPLEKVGVFQKQMIQKCNLLGKPVITATQMLESMITNPRPTRAEATDVLNAVLDGTDAVMLSGETANGDFPVEAVKFQSRISATAESIIDYHLLHSRFREFIKPPITFQESIAFAAVQCSEDVKASLILVVTATGTMARRVSRSRPRCPILAVTWSEKVSRELLVSCGCLPYLVSAMPDHMSLIKVILRARQLKLVLPGDAVVLAFGVTGVPNFHNTLSVITVDE
eukprot:TRINITY_DN476_c0_g1_i1.p1 TRINITY_DN476_c0_g1~~TRINITY_DN476_c0_g1_i1.p1  ORF type:complete len:521 (-),score=148.20 TRINITY_DN476_c0_g1_i1:91-1536(-)